MLLEHSSLQDSCVYSQMANHYENFSYLIEKNVTNMTKYVCGYPTHSTGGAGNHEVDSWYLSKVHQHHLKP